MSAAENSNDSTTQSDPAAVRLEPSVNDVDPISGASVAPNSIEGLFLRALRLETPAERDVLIREACGNDLERIQRVTALLRAYEDAGSFLETPVGGSRATPESSLSFLLPSDKEGVLGTIGPYEVLDEIGRGGMGVVMRAVDPKLNRVVAVKALLPELAANPNARRRFLREAQAAAAISHPHVVAIHAVDDAHQDVAGKPVPPYLVMECVIGQSLQQKLDRVGPLRLAEILRISRQIGKGLAAAHKQGVIHRDIKPANILLENGVERVKITDFGLARVIDDMTVTRTGEVCGTPQYMSPEQASGERVDQRSDLFSLGCVMYAMCTGHSPFRGDSIAHVIKRVTQDTPRPIADQNPEIPSWLTDIINSLLQKNAEQRFQSADGLAAILDQHLSRIQHPTESGSHSAINEQFSARGSMGPMPSDAFQNAASLSEAANNKGGLTIKIDTRWLSYRFAFLSVILVVASMLILPLLWLVSLAVRDAINGNSLSILHQEFWMFVFAQKMPTLALLGTVIAATFQTLFIFNERQKHRRVTLQAYSETAFETDSRPVNAPLASSSSENVSMQFGSTIVPVPLASALHYTVAKSIGCSWILLALGGVILSLVVHPTLSLAANTAQMLSQALQFPASLFGVWIMTMLGTKIFRPNQVPKWTWALVSSSSIACMALGYFWTTVARMPFSGNLNEISPRSLMGAAILPTLIGLMYCGYVFREITKNPESLQGLQNLTGPNARLSCGAFLALVISVLIIMGLVALLFYGSMQSTLEKTGNVSEVTAPVAVEELRPSIVLIHPDWGKIREILINHGGSTRQERSKTETVVMLKSELGGTIVNIDVILMDGREWRRYGHHLARHGDNIVISDTDLALTNRSLVEVVEDAPGVKLRMVSYPGQYMSVNEFSILNPPFHKAMEQGEHHIVLDYVLDEWELPKDIVQFNKLDYRVKVLDDKPLKLSLKEIIEQHGAEAKTTRMTWKPDFKPLKKD